MKTSEQELAATVVAHLKEFKWEVYQEVDCGTRADIVAKLGPVTWVIETKTSMSLAVVTQAVNWKGWANMISIAVQPSRNESAVAGLLKMIGIGLLTVGDWGVRERVHPAFMRHANQIVRWLKEEQKSSYAAAGSARGGHYTSFKGTAAKVQEYVRNHPGCSIADLLKDVPHHYSSTSSARACLTTWIMKGVIKDIVLTREKGKISLRYEKEAKPQELGGAR